MAHMILLTEHASGDKVLVNADHMLRAVRWPESTMLVWFGADNAQTRVRETPEQIYALC